jgi:hypothetical protein
MRFARLAVAASFVVLAAACANPAGPTPDARFGPARAAAAASFESAETSASSIPPSVVTAESTGGAEDPAPVLEGEERGGNLMGAGH